MKFSDLKVPLIIRYFIIYRSFPDNTDGKESACVEEDPGSIPEMEDPLEEEMGTDSSVLRKPHGR